MEGVHLSIFFSGYTYFGVECRRHIWQLIIIIAAALSFKS